MASGNSFARGAPVRSISCSRDAAATKSKTNTWAPLRADQAFLWSAAGRLCDAGGAGSILGLRCTGVLFHLGELLFELRQARHQRTIGFVLLRLLLHLLPAFGSIQLGPRPVRCRIKDVLLGQVLQRPVVFVEIENAIAHLEIEIAAVQFVAEFQAVSECLLRHPGVENPALELVDGWALRVQAG